MSAGFLGALAGVGPGIQSGLESREKIAASKSERTIAEAQERRNAEKHKWQKMFGDIAQARELMDSDPAAFNQWMGFMGGEGPIAAVPAISQQTPVQQALPGIGSVIQPIQPVQPQPQQLPGMAAGGPVQVPPQQQAALPVGAVAGEAIGEMTPGPTSAPTSAPAANMPSRRERYNKWYGEAAKYAALTGGLEGYKAFQDMENATSRRQVLGFGLQAVQMLDEGNVGEAMRAGNSALESTPFDTGLKFQANEGKLYMVGKDGVPGQPLSANDLRAYIENHMKTPEDYLEWKQQYETERSNLETERLRGGELDVSERQVAVQERRMDLDEELGPRDTAAREMTAAAAALNADARLKSAVAKASAYGWDEDNALRISQEVRQWSLDEFTGYNKEAEQFYKDNPQEFTEMKSGVAQIMLSNPWDKKSQRGMVDPDLAATIYQLVTLPGAVNLKIDEGDFQIATYPDYPGVYFANYKGQIVTLPPILTRDAKRLHESQPKPKPKAATEEDKPEDPAVLPDAEKAALESNTGGVIGTGPGGYPVVDEQNKQGRSRKARRSERAPGVNTYSAILGS